MNDDIKLPEIERYVLSLIAVALQGPKTFSGKSAMVENAALRVSLDWMGKLPEASSNVGKRHGLIQKWTEHMPPAKTAFDISAHLAEAIDQAVRVRHPSIKLEFPCEPTKFDQHVFIALGQTIAHAVGFRNGTGPAPEVAWDMLSKQSPRSLQQVFLRNYLGNLLQDYFDECEIRAKIATLGKNEEEALRTQDAEDLAEVVFGLIKASDNPLSADLILSQLRRVVAYIWRMENEIEHDSSQGKKPS